MGLRRKHVDPIDRAVSDLDQQIASLQRQMRELTGDPPRANGIRAGGDKAPPSPSSPKERFTRFLKRVLPPSEREAAAPRRVRQDLFDVGAEPLKELEAEPIAFAQRPEPDLFVQASTGANGAGVAALETAQVVPPHEKLAHYLGAGSIKNYKPLKRAQRETRNRFFMWLGLSFLALWIIWFVIR